MSLHSSVWPVIGVDVGSRELVIAHDNSDQAIQRIANQPKAIDAWLGRLPAKVILGMEATGRHHEWLAERATHCGHRVYVINPKRLAHYAKGVGQRGKTDPQDALVIARYVAREGEKLHPYTVPTTMERTLRDLLSRRANLVKHGGAIRQCLKVMDASSHTLQQAERVLLESLEALIATLDRELKAVVKTDPALNDRRALLQTISGIGALNSVALAYRFQRTPFANSDAVVAAYGMDPRPKDSGNKVGKRCLSKEGNPEHRRLIYLAAQSAARTKTFKPLYDALRAKGFATTQAILIIARKILRIAFAVWTTNQPFNKNRVGQPACDKP